MRTILTGSYLAGKQDLAFFVLRVVTGIVFMLHGWQKLEMGLTGVSGFLGGLGFPMPMVFAVLLIAAELLGGIMLIVGALTRFAAQILTFVSLVALLTVHVKNGFFLQTGGYEYILVLFAACVALAVTGAGKWSLDHRLWRQ